MNIWQYKPWWCQPWSIILTGIIIIITSWLLFQVMWLTVIIAIPILIWMGFFLLVYPRLMLQFLEHKTEQVESQNSSD